MIEAEQLHARILDELDLSKEVEDEELTRIIYRVLREAESREYLPLNVKTALGRELFNAFRKLDLLEEFLEDDEITEVMINGTQNIFYEKKGRIFQSDKRFLSKEKLEDVIQQIVAGANRLVNEASPIVDATGTKKPLFEPLSVYLRDPDKEVELAKRAINILNKHQFGGEIFEQGWDYFSSIFEYLIKDYNKDSGKYAEYYTPAFAGAIMADILYNDNLSYK